MARLRLLISVLAPLLLVGLLVPSCWTWPTRVVHTPEIAGRVIDHETREPVAGAEVFVGRYALTPGFPHDIPTFFATRWTTTDADGRFRLAAEETPVPKSLQRSKLFEEMGPWITVIHPAYGRAQNAGKIGDDYGNIEWEAVVDRRTFEALARRERSSVVCGRFDRAGYIHCCDVFYGPDHVCVGR